MGLISLLSYEMIDALGEIEAFYSAMYLADYTPFRLGTVLNQSQYDYLFWRQIQLQMLTFYKYDFDEKKPMPSLTEYLQQGK